MFRGYVQMGACMLCSYIMCCAGLVHEVTHSTLDKFLKDKLFTLTFVDKPACTRCSQLFPFYVAASQNFPRDPDIFFTRTSDVQLIKKWNIEELPSLIYHRAGLSNYERLNIDITVDDVIDAIARALHGDFGGLTRTYSAKLTDKNYHELIVKPHQYDMILIHDKDDKSELAMFEKVAYAFRKDEAVMLATLDVSKYKPLRDGMFKSRDTPTVIWLSAAEKDKPKRFGGVYSSELLTAFINEKTRLGRNLDGALQPEAGVIPAANSLLRDNAEGILNLDIETMEKLKEMMKELKNTEENHHHDFLDYYMFLIDNVISSGGFSILKDMESSIDGILYDHEEKSTRTEETLKRRKNILHSFQIVKQDYLEQMRQAHEDDVTSNTSNKKELKVIFDETSDHLDRHIHSEL